jgi:hypothetical protein
MLGTINILQLTLLASLFLTSNVQHLSILTKFLQSVRPCRAAAVLAFCTSFDVLVVLVGLVAGTKQIEPVCLQPEPFPISTGFFIFFFFFFFYHDGAEKGTSRNLGKLSDLEKSLICFFFLPLRTTTTTPHSPSARRFLVLSLLLLLSSFALTDNRTKRRADPTEHSRSGGRVCRGH